MKNAPLPWTLWEEYTGRDGRTALWVVDANNVRIARMCKSYGRTEANAAELGKIIIKAVHDQEGIA